MMKHLRYMASTLPVEQYRGLFAILRFVHINMAHINFIHFLINT